MRELDICHLGLKHGLIMCVVYVILVCVFACRHECSIKHFQISQVSQQSGSVYVLDRQFQTLDDLVSFYSQRDVPNVEAIAGVRLTHPVAHSSDEVASLHEGTPRQRQSRRVSDGDSPNTHQQSRMIERSSAAVHAALHHSVSESQSDGMLLPKDGSNWGRRILRKWKPSNRKSRVDSDNGMRQSVANSHTACEVNSNTLIPSRGSMADSAKKYGKQPAIPDDSTAAAALPSTSGTLLADAAEALAAAAANYNAAAAVTDADPSLYYSEPRDVNRELSRDFMAVLQKNDNEGPADDTKCVCGLDLADSVLPRGWSMHKSTEPGTEGRLFFTSPTGDTSWELPTIVSVDLDAEQQDRIRRLMIEGQNAAGQDDSELSVSRQFLFGDKRISV